MKVGIIGAGFGGLAAAHRLVKAGVDTFVFESSNMPGGLAVGFKEEGWDWSLEKHYHHLFKSDKAIKKLAEEIGHSVIFKRPKTSSYIGEGIYQLDSPLSLLKFSKLSFIDRLRTGVLLGYLKFTPDWKRLERVTAESFIKKYMGRASWKILWGPLFKGKFRKYSSKIPASWFLARVKKRSASLGYPEGGFLSFSENLVKSIRQNKGNIYYNFPIEKVYKKNGKIILKTSDKEFAFDSVICTLPSFLFVKITPGLPKEYKDKLLSLNSVGTVNLVLSLTNQFLEDNTYWLNINTINFPFLAIVEHTNFIDKKYYAGEHQLYIGNYLPHDHRYYRKEAIDLLREFYPYLKKINPKFDKSWVKELNLFKAPFSQPIIPLNYSRLLPSFETPIEGVYLCNIQQVYPWDRGTNYAVENGEKVADLIINC